jgi:ATP-dependent Clp protease ATP-binding subunit ClpB
MSEYQEMHTVSRLIGAPPGYIGYEESGQLTEAVRRRPYSVVLLDEIEKAHPDVFNILLQVLDEGRLTDNKGRTADFKNTIIIMTSNLGSQLIQEKFNELDDYNREQVLSKTSWEVMDLLKKTIKPEFLNRVDEVVMFNPLTREEIKQIVIMQLEKLKETLAEKQITFTWTDYAVDWLAELGYDPLFGARPLKRVIQTRVVNQLSKQLLAGKLENKKTIKLDMFEKEFVFINK